MKTTGAKKTKARFFEPMQLLATNALPEGEDWEYELLCGGLHNSSYVAHSVMWLPRSRERFESIATRENHNIIWLPKT
jgi:hypothetical protein